MLGSPREFCAWLVATEPLIRSDHPFYLLWVLGHEVVDALSAQIGVRSSRPKPQLMVHASAALISEAVLLEQPGVDPELSRRAVSVLMTRALHEDHFRCLFSLASQARLRFLLRPRAPWSGLDGQHGCCVPLLLNGLSMDCSHSDDLASVHRKQVLTGARVNSEPGASETLRRQLGLPVLGLLR